MIVIPILQPEKFRKQVRTESEITNADFIMNTEIKFKQAKTFYHKVKMLPNGPTVRTYYENIDPEVSYVFQSKITISGYEFIKNRENIKEYVVNKLKQRSDWKEQILKYIAKESDNKRHSINIDISKEPNNPKLHYRQRKIEEYIPQY